MAADFQLKPEEIALLNQRWRTCVPKEAELIFETAGGKAAFHVLVQEESGLFRLHTLQTLEEVRTMVTPFAQQNAHAFVFLGQQLPVGKRGEQLVLVTPAGEVALTPPVPLTIRSDGFLGDEPVALAAIKMPVPEIDESPVAAPGPNLDDETSSVLGE